MQTFSRIVRFLEATLFPPLCLLCRAHLLAEERTRWLCETCTIPFDFPIGFFCPFCKKRSPTIPSCHPETRFAGIAPWKYENKKIRNLIHLLKYDGIKAAAIPLGEKLRSYLLKSAALGAVSLSDFTIVPVPLHPRKLRKRGFNQSLLLARSLRIPEIPIFEHVLIRTRSTPSQTALENRKARMKNVRGSFAVSNEEAVRGRNILLLDDVITSGATMREAAMALKKGGAKRIIGLAVARAS